MKLALSKFPPQRSGGKKECRCIVVVDTAITQNKIGRTRENQERCAFAAAPENHFISSLLCPVYLAIPFRISTRDYARRTRVLSRGNEDAPRYFADTENPKVTMCPVSFEVRLSPGERNRLIFWQEPTFTDNVGVEHVYKTRVCTRPRNK